MLRNELLSHCRKGDFTEEGKAKQQSRSLWGFSSVCLAPPDCMHLTPPTYRGGCCLILQKKFRVSGTCTWQVLEQERWLHRCRRLYLRTNELEEEGTVNWVPARDLQTPLSSPGGHHGVTSGSLSTMGTEPLSWVPSTLEEQHARICVSRAFSGHLQSLQVEGSRVEVHLPPGLITSWWLAK